MWHSSLLPQHLPLPLILVFLFIFPVEPNILWRVLKRSFEEQPYETILLLQHERQEPCNELQQVSEHLSATWPVLRFNTDADFYLRSSQSSEMLALICPTGNLMMDLQVWQALAKNLYNMRHIRVLVVLQQAAFSQQLQSELWKVTAQYKFPHVVVHLSTDISYQLQPYGGAQHWLEFNWSRSRSPIFARQNNYQQRVAHTLPDQITSLSYVYVDKQTGRQRLTGFVARLMQEFARVHNISLQWHQPVVPGKELSSVLLRNMTLNGTLQLPITLCGFEMAHKDQGIYSYPYDISPWFVMVPCPRELPIADIYPMLFHWRMLVMLFGCYCIFVLLDACLAFLLTRTKYDWTNFICNERLISALIGQSFKLRADSTNSSRILQAQLFFIGLTVSTLFAAHLKTLLAKLPTERKISNFVELKNSHLQVYFEESEHFYINQMTSVHIISSIKPQIVYLPPTVLYEERGSLRNSNAFATTATEWEITRRQQELFQQPTFCYYPDLVFHLNLLMSVPLTPNSIYAQQLDLFIHQVHASGLLNYWKSESVRDLIALGHFSLLDPYAYQPFHEFKFDDLYWIWLSWSWSLLFALLVFIGELLAYHIQRNI